MIEPDTVGGRSDLFFDKTLGCLLGGLIGDAMGTPTEGMDYRVIEERFGRITDFDCDGTDDTIMKNLLAEALIRTDGFAGCDEWAGEWLRRWDEIFGSKVGKFFQSVLHTAAKLKNHGVPRMAALGNMPSSSSAMCISPVGIVNACDPRGAAEQAYALASLIHTYDVAFCQDGAAAIAAATAQAFQSDSGSLPGSIAGIDEIIDAARAAIHPESGAEMRDLIDRTFEIVETEGEYAGFRAAVYERRTEFFRRITCDSRETVPITLALFRLSGGDVEKAVVYGANFGRDADTIATMCGSIAGAYAGASSIKPEWGKKARRLASVDQDDLARRLMRVAVAKHEALSAARERFASLSGLSVRSGNEE